MSQSLVRLTALVLIVALFTTPLTQRATAEVTTAPATALKIGVVPKYKAVIATPKAKSYLSVERGGTYVTFRFSVTGSPKVAISKVPLNVVQDAAGFERIANYLNIESSQTDVDYSGTAPREITFMDLKPATTYYYAIVILGTPTPISGWSGSFHTKTRHVAVSFTMIQVHDDTDDFGAGELAFRYQIFEPTADFWAPDTSLDHVNDPLGGYHDIASGDSYWPLVTLHSDIAAESVVVAISAIEDDAPWNYGANHEGDQFLGFGSNDNYEWNSGAVGVALSGLTLATPSAPTLAETEELVTSFFIDVTETDDTCMEYTLWAEVHMTYE